MHQYLGPIRAYDVLYFFGIALLVVLALYFSRRLGVPRKWGLIVGISFAFSMTAGARMLYDTTHALPWTARDLFSLDFYTRGGLWGGLLVHLALMTGLILVFARRRAALFDLVALTLPLPLMLAKIGCFLAGCCYGTPTALPWGVTFPPNRMGTPADVPLHPTQLYEAGMNLVIFVILFRLRRSRRPGLLLPWFLLLYGAGRGLLEFLRGDAAGHLALGPVTVSQLLCIATALVAAALLFRIRSFCPPERRF